MKSPTIIIIFLIITCAFVPCTEVKAEPALIPHEDPAAAQSAMDSYAFLAQYADLFALMSNRQYDNASRLSEQLSHITVPEDLSYVIDRYNQLTQQLIAALNDLQNTLDTASTLLNQYRLDEAGQALDHAGVLVAKAQMLIGDLKDATSTLSQRLGVFATPAESKVRQAYDQLQSMLQRLNDLINQYHTLLQKANQRVEEIKSQNLAPTALSLSLNTTKCFVGGSVTASGTLTLNERALENRAVKLLLDGNQVTSTNTQANGNYQATIKIPYKYVDSVSISAIYSPEGDDQGVHLAALSPTIEVQVLFYKTMLNLSVPNVAYPGLLLTISGSVSSQDGTPLNQRQVQVQLDGAVKSQVKTETGAFTFKFTIDAQTQIGKHSLTVSVEPEGLYAGITEQRTIYIQKMATDLKINAPSFILLPTQLQISGTANSASGPLKNANIQIDFTNTSATTKTQDDGSFNLTINIPLNTVLAGYQELTVKAQPTQPWQAAAETKASIFALNSVSTSLALVSSLSVFAVTYFKFAKTKKKKENMLEAETSTISPASNKAATATIPTTPEIKFEGVKGKVLKAYVEALKAVQVATGDSLTSNMTLREYTRVTGSKIGEAADPFFELTTLTEKSLYSPHVPQQEDSEKAENLANTIRRILTSGST
jgi:hypothetical protein